MIFVYFPQDIEQLLKIDNINFRAIAPPKYMIKLGETVYANINISRSHLFDSETEECIA